MFKRIIQILFVLLISHINVIVSYMPNYIVVTRQDINNTGFIETYDGETGYLKLKSNVSFNFRWPYVQMNTNINHNKVYTLVSLDINLFFIFYFYL